MISPMAMGQDIVPVLNVLNDFANEGNTLPPNTPIPIAKKIQSVRNLSKKDSLPFFISAILFPPIDILLTCFLTFPSKEQNYPSIQIYLQIFSIVASSIQGMVTKLRLLISLTFSNHCFSVFARATNIELSVSVIEIH